MAISGISKIVIDSTTYDILSADTNFYGFMDDGRLYYEFTRLIHEDDLQMFISYAEKAEPASFMLKMLAVDGTAVPYYVTIEEGSKNGQLNLSVFEIAKVIEENKSNSSTQEVQSKIIELYGDDIFIYYPKTDTVNLITKYNIAPMYRQMSLSEFEALLRKHVKKDRQEDVLVFIMALKTGNRYFEICVEGDIMNSDPGTKYTVVKGAAVYEDGERVVSAGYIHKSEKQSAKSLRKTELDSLTGVLSKGEITDLVTRAIDVEKRQNVSIAIVDVDHFKKVNDTYGHMEGDRVLKAVAAIMDAEVGNSGLVGRIGGDEFFILFYDAYDLEEARERLRSIMNNVAIRFPENQENKPVITLSIGCAAYPKDAENYSELFALADFALYRAKEKGRNRYIIYDKEKHGTMAEMHKNIQKGSRINNRGDMSYGDILCVIMDKVYSTENYPIDRLLDDYLENFDPQRITIYAADTAKVLHMVGEQVPVPEVIEQTRSYIQCEFWQKKYVYDDIVINNIHMVETKDQRAYELMKKQGILSCIHIKFNDKNGERCILSLESVSKKVAWNSDHMHYYKLMARILSNYVLVQ